MIDNRDQQRGDDRSKMLRKLFFFCFIRKQEMQTVTLSWRQNECEYMKVKHTITDRQIQTDDILETSVLLLHKQISQTDI